MPKARGKTPGWAAVDIKLRHGAGPDLESEPYPPVQNAIGSLRLRRNSTRSNGLSTRPMSSLAMPTRVIEREQRTDGRVSSKKYKGVVVDENVQKLSVENLMTRDCTADRTQMCSGPFDCLLTVAKDLSLQMSSFFNDAIASITNRLKHLKLILSEPQGEEDDVYLSHRKDAIKLMRSAAQHSRMASSAFLKGDHYSAQQHSSRAREDRSTANNLHAKAAKEILSINNNKNDMWKLDLHGLHATEAVKALQNHLMMIETQSSSHRSIYPKRVTGNHILAGSSSSESLSYMIKDIGPGVSTRQRPKTLLVITGRGIHSKGHPVLPAAVRGFLDENGYGYDGTRAGVINVRPKFRRGKSVPK